jgi:hypothetical protein
LDVEPSDVWEDVVGFEGPLVDAWALAAPCVTECATEELPREA